MDVCVPEVVAVGTVCIYEGCLPGGPEGSEDPGLAGLQYSHGSLQVSGSMRHHTNLGQGFHQCARPW